MIDSGVSLQRLDSMAAHSSEWVVLPIDGGSERELPLDVFLCRGVSSRPLAVVVAGVHGDEYEGPTALAQLATRLFPDSMRGSVVAIPVANPLAFSAGQRTTPADGLNLARTFPGHSNGSPTERLAAGLFELVADADYLIDLHSGGVDYCFLPLAGFYGTAEGANGSYQAARHFGLSVLWRAPETDGVLSYEAWKRGTVAFGAEYLGAGQLSAEGASRYVLGVLSCLALWEICAEDRLLSAEGRVYTGDWQLATGAGLFRARCSPGDTVYPGQELAEIVDIRGATLQRFVSPERGLVLAIRSKAYIREGDWGVLVATDQNV